MFVFVYSGIGNSGRQQASSRQFSRQLQQQQCQQRSTKCDLRNCTKEIIVELIEIYLIKSSFYRVKGKEYWKWVKKVITYGMTNFIRKSWK